MIKLKCIKENSAHWGKILSIGKYYEAIIIQHEYKIITDYDKYYHYIGLLAKCSKFIISEGYTKYNLQDVVPGYMSRDEIMKRYTLEIKVPMYVILGDDDKTYHYCTLSENEILEFIKSQGNKIEGDKVKFTTSIYLYNEYFLTQIELRRKALLKLL